MHNFSSPELKQNLTTATPELIFGIGGIGVVLL